MQFRQLFFIEGKLLGEAPREAFFLHGELAEPLSALWFCQHCGEVFAKAPVMRINKTVTPWQSYRATCRKCPPKAKTLSEVPGSIWLSWDYAFLDSLPKEVLRSELLALIERHENG